MFFYAYFYSMRRVRLHSKKKMNALTIILLLILLFIISLLLVFNYIGKSLSNKVEEYSMVEAKKIISNLINKSIEDDVVDNLRNDLFVKNNNTIDFDSYKINRLILLINKKLKDNLNKLEKGELEIDGITLLKDMSKIKKGVIYEVPSGVIFNNALLSNIGPKIPVKLHMLGDANVQIDTRIKDYGINNAIIELYVKVNVSEQMILPFSTRKVEVEEFFPIAIKLIEGSIPDYYSGSIPIHANDSSKTKK